VDEIVRDFKEFFPKHSKRYQGIVIERNPYMLRELDRMRDIDKKSIRFVNKIDSMRDNLTVYEHLQLKPAMYNVDFADYHKM
jgi:pheromone shutdown protein TraB